MIVGRVSNPPLRADEPGRVLIHGSRDNAACRKQGAALSPADDGPAERAATAARGRDHEDLPRRARRTLQSDAAQSGVRTENVRSSLLSALADIRAFKTQ